MLRAEEERFVKLAVRLGVLDEARRAEALRLAAEAGADRHPVPFFLLEHDILTDAEVDRVLEAMVELLDKTVAQADALRRDRQFTQAISKYDSAIRANPNHEESYWGRADAYYARGALAEALQDYDKVVELTNREAEARLARGTVLARLDRLEDALVDLQAAVRGCPGNSSAHFELGSCLHRLGRLELAIEAYSRAIELEPAHVSALNNRAIVHLLRRDVEAAKADWETCLILDRRRGTVRHNLRVLLSKAKSQR